MKAYKRVDWIFLDLMMRATGFSDRLILMIMICSTPARISIKLNGGCSVIFTLSRGLWQGDRQPPLFVYFPFCGFFAWLMNTER